MLLPAALELLVRDDVVELEHVRAQAARRLRRHLDAALQDRDGELGRRRRAQPQAVARVRVLRLDVVLDDLLEARHPREHQVAVREEHPVPRPQAVLQHAHRRRRLALPERAVVHVDVHLLREREHVRRGVHARREHEDERRVRVRRLVDGAEVEGRRVHEIGAHVLAHEVGRREEAAVHAQRAQDAHLLQVRALVLPVAWQALVLRRVAQVPGLPVARDLLEARHEARKGAELVQLRHVVPGGLVHPLLAGVRALVRAVHDDAAEAEVVELVLRELVVVLQDLEAELQREEQLVALEEPAADVAVHRQRVVRVDGVAALAHVLDGGLPARSDGVDEEAHVGVQAELVHGVHARQVVEHEVRQARADGGCAVPLARHVDVALRLLGDLQLRRHLLGGGLGHLQRLDELHVIEQRARGLAEQPQDLVLELHELALAVGHAHRELALLQLELGLLLLHDGAQQLRLEALLLHGEVHDVRLGAHLRRVVRVAELRRDVQLEVGRVVQLLVAEADDLAVADLLDGLGEHRLERRV
mmetsp:Transcript_34849/g.109443  ORF Transcript_34849/g.109443 Transcript_34849/m.109443 type:complete len:531 (-) Transcript_34849:195-1787(-)